MSDFATTLRRLRFERNMSQEEFATFLGTSKQNISRYENGEVSPKISTAAAIAEKLGVSLTELNGGSSNENDTPTATHGDPGRMEIAMLFASLTEENQQRLLDFAQVLLQAQQASSDSRQ